VQDPKGIAPLVAQGSFPNLPFRFASHGGMPLWGIPPYGRRI
jgi:hypothetical protein